MTSSHDVALARQALMMAAWDATGASLKDGDVDAAWAAFRSCMDNLCHTVEAATASDIALDGRVPRGL